MHEVLKESQLSLIVCTNFTVTLDVYTNCLTNINKIIVLIKSVTSFLKKPN